MTRLSDIVKATTVPASASIQAEQVPLDIENDASGGWNTLDAALEDIADLFDMPDLVVQFENILSQGNV